MTGMDFLEKINDIDSDLLEAADLMPKKKKRNWQIYLPIAAAFILAFGIGYYLLQGRMTKEENQNTLVAFYYDDVKYETPGLNDYVRLGLVSQETENRSGITVEQVSKKDLGEYLGQIKINSGAAEISCKVYKHIAFQERNVLIIVFPDGDYQIYIEKE